MVVKAVERLEITGLELSFTFSWGHTCWEVQMAIDIYTHKMAYVYLIQNHPIVMVLHESTNYIVQN